MAKTVQKPKVKVVSKPVKAVKKTVVGTQLTVLGIDGKAKGKVTVAGGVFTAKSNPMLLAQAVRIFQTNQRRGTASTKTRGEVEGSTRKIYRQKGTGRARHGAIRAPIFVGGGITFGPQPRDFGLHFPKKMKKAALANALSTQLRAGNVVVVDGLEALPAKTKVFAKAIRAVGKEGKTLVVITNDAKNIFRGARNIENVDIISATNLNTYVVLSHTNVIIAKTALPTIWKTFS